MEDEGEGEGEGEGSDGPMMGDHSQREEKEGDLAPLLNSFALTSLNAKVAEAYKEALKRYYLCCVRLASNC